MHVYMQQISKQDVRGEELSINTNNAFPWQIFLSF